MKSTGLVAIVASFVLWGCAGTDGARIEKACDAPKDTMISVQDGSHVVVNQDPIYVCKQNIKITWYLDPSQASSYEFRDDSIVIKDPQNNNEFSNCKGQGNGGEVGPNKDTIKCHDKKDKSGAPRSYKYDIRIYNRNGGADPAATYDPNIVND